MESISDFELIVAGTVVARLAGAAGTHGEWDDVAVVEYPSVEALRTLLQSPDYLANAEPHRVAALEDWTFLALVAL